MKKTLLPLIILIGLYANSSSAVEIQGLSYLSPRNFQMPAFEIQSSPGHHEVTVIAKEALLTYPDSGLNFLQRNRLGRELEVDHLNALVITFTKEDCQAKDINSDLGAQIFACKSNHRSAQVRGAVVDHNGQIELLGDVVKEASLTTELRQLSVQSAIISESFLQATLVGTVFVPDPTHFDTMIDLALFKSDVRVQRK